MRKRSDFDGLREAREIGVGEELRLDATALTEAVNIFPEGRDEAEIVEQRRMKEIGERADFAGHLLREGAGFFEGTRGGFFLRGQRLANLGEAEIDGENGLRKAVVKFTAEAAALFILKLQKLRGEIVDRALCIFHFGDIGERADDTDEVCRWSQTAGTALPKIDRMRSEPGRRKATRPSWMGACVRKRRERDDRRTNRFAVFADRVNAKVGENVADSGAVGDI